MNKELDPLARIEKMWYVTFFVRYWRKWILKHPHYPLQNNFITHNAYICIELNAHAIIVFLITLRNNKNDDSYLRWLLGSQCCEKMFRLAKSMTSTFSTMINFGMLGLLRRLHRLHIQSYLQAESATSGIIYPQLQKHKNKSGKNCCIINSLKEISDTSICETVKTANDKAKITVEKLGMEVLNLVPDEECSKELETAELRPAIRGH